MTSNQIAAASVREDIRHNKAYEEETARHNKAVESIDEERNNITSWYNTTMAGLQSDYNKAYLEYLNADMEQKYALEDVLANIKQQQADADAKYKYDMSIINAKATDADKAYKEAMSKVSYMNAQIEAKRAYYEGQKTEGYLADLKVKQEQAWKDLEQKKLNIEMQYQLGIYDWTTRNKELNLAQREYELRMKQWDDVYAEQNKAKTDLLQAQTGESKASKNLKNAQTAKTWESVVVDPITGLVDSVMPF
nr:putative ORF1 [Picobirnavirus sp.]